MIKTVLEIDGMACGMCEAHVNDAVRSSVKVKKVTSSYKKGLCEILSETKPDTETLRRAVESTGYRVISVNSEQYVKRGLFQRHTSR